MTCHEMAQVVYWYCKKKPSTKEEIQIHSLIRSSKQCQAFLIKMRRCYEKGELNMSYGEIPDELMEAITPLIRKASIPIAC